MTSIGRGRGWGRPTERESVLRRPGQPSSPKSSELDELIDRIYDLQIDDASPVDKVRDLATLIDNLGKNQTSEELAQKLWPFALEDRCFGVKLAKLFYHKKNIKNLSTISAFPGSMKKTLLQKMQECYERREELRKENPLHLSNLAWLIGATIETSWVPRGMLIHIGPALINCCSLLLDTATEDDTETVAIQFYLNSKAIDASLTSPDARKSKLPLDPVGLNEIVNKARTNLVNRNVSTRTRALLLLIIDFANQHYEPLTGDLQAFYASVLGSSRSQENDSQFRTGREFNSESYFYEILTRGMKLPGNKNNAVTPITHETARNELPPPQVQKKNHGPNGGGSAPLPRAIRGSGASETPKEHKNDKRSPRGHKEKLTDEQVWSAKQNTGSKVWGHDDRFDNDYESK